MWLRVGLQGSERFELKDEWDSDGLRHFRWRFQSEQRQGSKKDQAYLEKINRPVTGVES